MDRSRQQLSSLSSSKSITNDICNDIITQILSWLPVDSLFRFKSVCKSWFTLITNPRFAKLHLLHHHHYSLTTTTTPQIHNPTIMFTSQTFYSLKSMDKLVSSSSSTVLEKLEMVYPLVSNKYLFQIVGSCNGLICISAYDHVDRKEILYLWNPSTKEFKLLPSLDAPLEFPSYHDINGTQRYEYKRYGFGYDHVMEDYKVIVSVQFFDVRCESDHQELRVYTLGTDSWRRIQGTPYKREWYRRRFTWSHVNGALHRIAQLSSSDIRILSFDIVEEVYGEVPEPKSFDGRCDWKLTVLRGCLCLYTLKGCMMEVWMMMNYGVKDSWTKLFNIPNGVEFSCNGVELCHLLKPVWFCRNGELLMKVDNSKESKLVIYDPKHNEAKLFKFRSNVRFETEIYIASLVSLKSHKEIEKELIIC